MSGPEVHDLSRVDAFMAARRRAMLMHAMWRPALAGALGAALVIAAVWVALPKFSYREVVVDHVTPRDVTVDHVVPKDVQVDRIVPREKVIEIPTIVTTRSPAEKAFVDSPAYAGAQYKGRIVASTDGRSLSFEDGRSFYPVDDSLVVDSNALVGDFAYCRQAASGLWDCWALHQGEVILVPQKKATRS